jgi:hypothetical protein
VAGQPGDGTVATFVSNLYRELMGREPDQAGFSFWASVAAGGNREEVIRGFLDSLEYRIHFVTTVYETFLNRAPDPGGLQFFVAILGANRDQLQIVSSIVGSQEYFIANGGTNQGFINALYRDLLGRPADQAGATFWISQADAGMARDRIVIDFLISQEGGNKIIDGNYASLTGPTSNSPAGAPQGGHYDLADLTGNGYGNLYFQGHYDQSAVNLFLAQLASSGQGVGADEDALIGLLDSPMYFNNTNT